MSCRVLHPLTQAHTNGGPRVNPAPGQPEMRRKKNTRNIYIKIDLFLPALTSTWLFYRKPMCASYSKCVAVLKGYNLRMSHFEKHQTSHTNLPDASQDTAANLQGLTLTTTGSDAQPSFISCVCLSEDQKLISRL